MMHLLRRDITSFVSNNYVICSIIVIGIAVSYLVFTLMIGVIQYEIESAEKNTSFQTISVDTKGTLIDKNKFYVLLSSTKVDTLLLIKTSDIDPMLVGWFGPNDDRWFVMDEGRFLQHEETEMSTRSVVLSSGLYPHIDLELEVDEYMIGESPYKVVGLGILPSNDLLFIGCIPLYERYYPHEEVEAHFHDDDESDEHNVEERTRFTTRQTCMVPYMTFLEEGFSPDILRIEYAIRDEETLFALVSSLGEIFPSADIYVPELPQQAYSQATAVAVLQSTGIVIVALINIVALFAYWLIHMKRTHCIYIILGITKFKLVFLIAVEWLLIVLSGCVVYIGLFAVLRPFLEFLSLSFSFSIMYTILAILIVYCSSMFMLAPQIRKNLSIDLEVL